MNRFRSASAFDTRSTPRLFCIGRNYAKHIEELNSSLPGAECIVFMKPISSLVAPDEVIMLPDSQGPVHHEAELVVEIAHGGRDIQVETAHTHIGGIGLGLDLTLREVQTELKKTGEPWERAKAFDFSAPLGPLVPLNPDMDLTDLHFQLTVDGEVRQRAHTRNMMVGVADLISIISQSWRLLPGDLIFTGTPEGVGPIEPGSVLALSGDGLGGAEWATA